MPKKRDVHDISVSLSKRTVVYPGDPPFSIQECQTADGAAGCCRVSRLSFCAHAGTHIDFESHMIQSGRTADMYTPDEFIMPAHVVDAGVSDRIFPEMIEEIDIKKGDAVLFKTESSRRGLLHKGEFTGSFVFIPAQSAHLIVRRQTSLVGIDYISVDRLGESESHLIFMQGGVMILEGADLSGVSPGSYTLVCLPLKICKGEASPVRAVLIQGEL